MPELDVPAIYRRGRGPPLILLHGLGLDHSAWNDLGEKLSQDLTVYSYDFPGHGANPPTPAYDIADLSNHLAGLMVTQGLDRAHIAGLSLGGLVAQHFAATHPDSVDRLILIDTTPSYPHEWRQIWHERAATARTQGVNALTAALLAAWFSPDFLAAGGPVIQATRAVLGRTSGEGYARGCEALAGAALEALAKQIAAPTLALCGRDDGPIFREALAWFGEHIAGSRTMWLPGRHAAVLEAPGPAAAAILEFLR